MTIHLEGPAVSNHRIPLQDLVLFGQQWQTAVNRVARVLLGQASSAQAGRTPAEIEAACALEVVALYGGSVQLVCDLPQNKQLSFTEDLGEEAIRHLVDGINRLVSDESTLPGGYDRGVLSAVRDSGKLFERGITKISIDLHTGAGHWDAAYTPEVRGKIATRILQAASANSRTVEGRLLMGDFNETGLKCRIHPPLGRPIPCSFDDSLKDSVLTALTHYVRAVGEATERGNEIQALRIQDIEVLDVTPPTISEGERQPGQSFFMERHDPLTLAAEQGVSPVTDLNQLLGDFWPEDESVDDFVTTLYEWRREADNESGGNRKSRRVG